VVWDTVGRYISQTYTNTMLYISAFDKISQYFTGNSLFENLDKFFTGVMKRIQSVFEMTEAVVKTLKGLYSGDFSGAKDAAFRAATHYTGGSTYGEKRNNAISDIEYRVGRGDKKEDIFDYIAKKVDKKGQAYATAKAEEMLRGRTSLLPSNDKKVGAGGNPLLTDLPTGKSQKDKGAAAGERGNNVRNVTITIQRIVGAEVVNIYGTDPNLTGLQRMVEQHTTEAIVRGVRDTELVLPNQ
jgi:phage-related protein